MSTITVTWKQGLTLPHDKDDVDDFTMDMVDVVGSSDTLSSATVTGVGVTAALSSATSQGVIVFRVSGGTAGVTGQVMIQATMSSGRKQSRTINFNVLER